MFIRTIAVAALVIAAVAPGASQSVTPDKASVHAANRKLYSEYARGKRLTQPPYTKVAVLEGVPVVSPEATPEQTISAWSADLACRADAVVLGTVEESSSFLTQEETFAFTDYDVAVTDVLKNSSAVPIAAAGEIVVTRPGGEVEFRGRRLKASDANYPPLIKGQRYLLFLQAIAESGGFRALQPGGAFLHSGNDWVAVVSRSYEPRRIPQDVGLATLVTTISARCSSGGAR